MKLSSHQHSSGSALTCSDSEYRRLQRKLGHENNGEERVMTYLDSINGTDKILGGNGNKLGVF